MNKYPRVILIFCVISAYCISGYVFAGEETSKANHVHVKGRKIYVDEKEFFVKGVAYALNYPKTIHNSQIPTEIFEKDFQMMKKAHINTIRTYQPLPDLVLDLAEKHNIMVIENIVYPGDWTDFKSKAELERLKNLAVRNAIRDKDRKCILAWDIWNDAPFTFGQQGGNVIRRFGEDTVNQFFKQIYTAVKEIDPNRPIMGSNLTYSDESLHMGTAFLDILSYNMYIGVHSWLDGEFSYEKAREQVSKLKEISIQYNKPVIVAETGYSSYLKSSSQEEALEGQVKAVRGQLAGIIIFEWADEWDKAGDRNKLNNHIEEHWGIVDGYRNPKNGYYKLKDIYKSR